MSLSFTCLPKAGGLEGWLQVQDMLLPEAQGLLLPSLL